MNNAQLKLIEEMRACVNDEATPQVYRDLMSAAVDRLVGAEAYIALLETGNKKADDYLSQGNSTDALIQVRNNYILPALRRLTETAAITKSTSKE